MRQAVGQNRFSVANLSAQGFFGKGDRLLNWRPPAARPDGKVEFGIFLKSRDDG